MCRLENQDPDNQHKLAALQSAKIVVKDEVTEVELTADLEDFTKLNGCLPTATNETIKPGETFLISSPQFNPAQAVNDGHYHALHRGRHKAKGALLERSISSLKDSDLK